MMTFRGVAPANDDSIILTSFQKAPLPKIEAQQISIPGRPGVLIANRQHETRTIKATYELNGKNAAANEALAAALSRWAESETPQELAHDERPGVVYYAQLENMTEPNLADPFPSINITFMCADPYGYSAVEKTAAVGAAFTYEGDVAAWPVIRFSVPSNTPEPAWQLNGREIKLVNFIALTGHLIIIDNKNRLITDNDVPIMDKLALSSDWLQIKTGNQTVTGSGGTVHWKDVYL